MATEDTIREKLTAAYAPIRLEIENESHKHSGHHGSPGTGDSHFNVLIIAQAFEGKGRLDRQRQIYATLADEMAGPIHALAMTVLTPDEATKRGLG